MDGSYVLAPSAGPSRTTQPAPSRRHPPATPPVDLSTSLSPAPTIAPTTRRERILDAIAGEGDMHALRKLASEPGGFQDTELRKLVWPVLLGTRYSKGKEVEGKAVKVTPSAQLSTPPSSQDPTATSDGTVVPEIHKDEGQVKLDVNRSFVSYPLDITPVEKAELRSQMEEVIVTVLRAHPALRYFQGYHDIISVLLLNFDDVPLTIASAERLSLHRIRDSMGVGLEPVLGYLKLVRRILKKADPVLSDTIDLAAELPFFSLSWILTLMSHDLDSIAVVSRLFDFLLAFNPVIISYLGVAIILRKKEELNDLEEDSATDPAILHHTLSRLPSIVDTSCHSSALGDDPNSPTFHSRSISTSPSFLSESLVSLPHSRSSSFSLSIDALEDSMLEDPDVTGPAFFEPPPSTASSPSRSNSIASTSRDVPSVSLDDLITKTLELYDKFPLLGEGGIAADEVMGGKSCIFTWALSAEDKLSDDAADEIARLGIDIIVSDVLPPTKEEMDADEAVPDERRSKKSKRTPQGLSIGVGIGTVLAILGVGGVLLAVYGGDLRASIQKGDLARWLPQWSMEL